MISSWNKVNNNWKNKYLDRFPSFRLRNIIANWKNEFWHLIYCVGVSFVWLNAFTTFSLITKENIFAPCSYYVLSKASTHKNSNYKKLNHICTINIQFLSALLWSQSDLPIGLFKGLRCCFFIWFIMLNDNQLDLQRQACAYHRHHRFFREGFVGKVPVFLRLCRPLLRPNSP